MNSRHRVFSRVVWITLLAGLTNHSFSSAAEKTLNGQTFTIPDGYTLELVAGPPLIDRPVSADFDELGRLYVTEASGTNDKVQQQLQDKPHRVLRLVDTDGDGRYDQRTVFADRMMLPEGALWYDGSLYVAAPPSIWKLTDTDDDGVADERSEWFQGKTLTGCANDLHGPYLGRDGWIYWCKGAFAEQTYERPGRKPFVTRAAHIFRRHPSGQGIVEPVMNGGMDNPVEVVFNLAGERFFTTTFLQHPGGGRRDGIIHAIYGGRYGKDHDVIRDHLRTGDLMPVMTHLGAAAACGLALLESDELGYRGQLVASLFNMRKVTRHVMQETGATYTTTDYDLVVSDSLDFHPTEVVEDADGSLLIVDTGGWYKLCCPTSQLEKVDVLGGIYRLRRTAHHRISDPRGAGIPWAVRTAEELVSDLADDRPVIRKRALAKLVRLGNRAVPALQRALQNASSQVAAEAVWALAQIEGEPATTALGDGLGHRSAIVRQAIMHAFSVRGAHGQADLVLRILREDPSLHVRRAAAEALGRIGSDEASRTMLRLASQTDDRVLEHSLIFALCELDDRQVLREGLAAEDFRTRGIAALAAEQSQAGSLLTVDDLKKLLSVDGDLAVKKSLLWIADRHPKWRNELVSTCAAQPATEKPSGMERFLAEFSQTEFAQELAAELLHATKPGSTVRLSALQALAKGRQPLPDKLVDQLIEILKTPQDSFASEAALESNLVLEILRNRSVPSSKTKSTADFLAAFAQPKDGLHGDWRTYASLPPDVIGVDEEIFDLLIDRLVAPELGERATALEAISRIQLTLDQRLAVAGVTDKLGPLELPQVLSLLAKTPSDAVGQELVRALQDSKAIGSIVSSDLATWTKSFSEPVRQQILATSDQRRIGLEDLAERISNVLPLVEAADVRRGQKLFHDAKAACISCHELGYLGGDIGPDLSRIANTRSPRDLLESILVPSASFVRSYEPWLVETTDGRIVSGVLRENSPDRVILVTTDRKEVHIERESIDEMKASEVSIMPAGLGGQITDEELADLVKFLMTAR